MFTTAKNSNRPPLTRKSCTGFPLFPPPPRVVGPGILGVRLGGRCPRKISWVANPSLRNKPTPGERETSLITARIRYRVSSPLPPSVIPRGFRIGRGLSKIVQYTLSSRWVGSAFEIESSANVWRTLALLLQKRERRREGCIAIREKIGLTWWKYVFFSFLFVLFVCYLEVQIYLNYLFNFDTGLIVDRIFLGNFSRFRFLKLCMNIYVG